VAVMRQSLAILKIVQIGHVNRLELIGYNGGLPYQAIENVDVHLMRWIFALSLDALKFLALFH
jgi:hypothetical protein